MNFKKCFLPVAILASFTLAGCQSNADDHAADVYQTDQLNSKQETKTVNIISVLPAKVAVDNTKNKQAAQTFGAVLGAVAGGVVGHNVGSGSSLNTTAGAVGGGAAGAAARQARQDKLDAEATKDKQRDQGYEDELRSLEIQKQKLALAKEEARVKRENEYIDQELKRQAAHTDVVQSEADANRNMSEGGRDLMKSAGKAEENKSDSWFN